MVPPLERHGYVYPLQSGVSHRRSNPYNQMWLGATIAPRIRLWAHLCP